MLVTSGRVRAGVVEVQGDPLPEGATATVLVPEGDETFHLGPDAEEKLLAAIAEADRGETVPAPDVLDHIRRR